MHVIIARMLTGILFLPICLTSYSQTGVTDKYDRKEVMIPMRDGVNLYTVIYTPKGQMEALPFLLERTPYGANKFPSPEKYAKDPAEEG